MQQAAALLLFLNHNKKSLSTLSLVDYYCLVNPLISLKIWFTG